MAPNSIFRIFIFVTVFSILNGATTYANDPTSSRDAEIIVKLSINVKDTKKSCAYYEWLGFIDDKACNGPSSIALLYKGNIRLTLLGSLDDSLEIKNLPILIKNYDLFYRTDEIYGLGGKLIDKPIFASTLCKTVADPDGHLLELCP